MIYDFITNKIKLKQEEYNQYIKEHRENVEKAFKELSTLWYKVGIINDDQIEALRKRVDRHDLSKYSTEEFEPYRRYFHYIDESERENAKEDFEIAWKHHYENNDHHPEYWKGEKMDDVAVMEMVCDWQAMRYKFGGGTVRDYYEENKEKKQKVINKNSIELLERLLSVV